MRGFICKTYRYAQNSILLDISDNYVIDKSKEKTIVSNGQSAYGSPCTFGLEPTAASLADATSLHG